MAGRTEGYSKGKLKPLGNNRYQVAELFSDGNGQVTTPYLPYGQYLAVETTVPKDHVQSKPFLLTFSRERTGTPVTVGITEETPRGYSFLKEEGELIKSMEAVYFSGTIDNEPVKQQLLLCKKDADTGKEVLLADVKFKIAKVDERTGKKTYLKHTAFYPGADSPEIFCTNGKGYLQLPMQLSVGTYVIEEVEGPQGFYNEGAKGYVTFRVTMDRDYQAVPGRNGEDVLLITETYFNRETKGVLTIRKQGEVLANYKEETLLQKVKAVLGMETRKQFVYEELPLAGAEYTIRAAEDIKTQDRQGTIRFKKERRWLFSPREKMVRRNWSFHWVATRLKRRRHLTAIQERRKSVR